MEFLKSKVQNYLQFGPQQKTHQEGPSPNWMNNHLNRNIKNKQGAYKGWKKGSTRKESYVLDVGKYTGKVRTARNETELNLEKKIKVSCKKLFGYRNKKRTREESRLNWNVV